MKKFSKEGVSLLDRADALSETRHNLTHGVITHMEARDGKYLLESRKIQKDGMHIVEEFIFDVREFPKLANKLVVLGRDAIQFSHRLLAVVRGVP